MVRKYACTACHGIDKAIVGPGYRQIADKYSATEGAAEMLTAKVKAGGTGVWGSVPMPPQAHVPDADLVTIVDWVLSGAPNE